MNYRRKNFLPRALVFVLLLSIAMTNTFVFPVLAKTNDQSSASFPKLNKFATDLTKLAGEDKLSVSDNFEREVTQLIENLTGADSRQPVLLDEIGESQELVVKALAVRIAKGDVPPSLKQKRVFKLEVNLLFADVKDASEAAARVETVINDLAKSKGEVILFVNELTNFIGASAVSEKLREAIEQGGIRIIGGSSAAAYAERIETQSEVAAMFAPIRMNVAGILMTGNKTSAQNETDRAFRGDNVSPDLRDMLRDDKTSGKKRLDVILQTKDADNPLLRRIMAENNIRLEDRIGASETMVVNLPLKAVERLAASGLINYMSPDRQMKVTGHLEETTGTSSVRSQAALPTRPAYTLDGSGVGIAVIDSGMQVNHKDFKNNGGSSRVLYSQNFVPAEADADDNYGHGTHVAGIAAGNSNFSNGAYKGMAPNANLINLKVLDGQGRGQTSWLLNALEWVRLNHQTYNIKVVNLSLGGMAIDSYTNDPACRKVQELSALGILVVAAAGNDGKNSAGQKLYGHIHSPGNDPSALTVGAINSKDTVSRADDTMATFSSNGPTRSFYTNAAGTRIYDNAIKPDIVAPGNKIVSARAKQTSWLVVNYPNLTTGLTNLLDPNDNMMAMSGTSMSTPVAAGAAALLMQVNPNLTPQMVKMILEYTAQPLNGYNMFEQGAGNLNVEGAVRLAKAMRTDLNFNTAAPGTSLLAAGVTFPTATTTLNNTTFNWSQGIMTNHGFLKGQPLATILHNVYKNGMWFQRGVSNSSSFHYVLNDNFYGTAGISLTAKAMRSNGATLGDGTVFQSFGVLVGDGVLIGDGVLVADGVLIADGVLVGDGVLIGDGVLTSDGVLVGDGVLIGDSTMANAVIHGDN